MSKQIAVRLPDEMVAWVDARVREGSFASRAELVAFALARERRAVIARRDAEILAREPQDADMDGLAEHVANMPLPLR
jgi:Arc/MetJ-type ribon-helix-helix transcriptional regulator